MSPGPDAAYNLFTSHRRTPNHEESNGMRESEINDYARQLLEAHGGKAVAEAAKRAGDFEQQGKNEQAQTWRRIEAALKLMRGPHEK